MSLTPMMVILYTTMDIDPPLYSTLHLKRYRGVKFTASMELMIEIAKLRNGVDFNIGGWKSFKFIPTARVPILKVESYLQNISCDISINNLKGQMKSKLLFCIGEIDGRFRDMVLLV